MCALTLTGASWVTQFNSTSDRKFQQIGRLNLRELRVRESQTVIVQQPWLDWLIMYYRDGVIQVAVLWHYIINSPNLKTAVILYLQVCQRVASVESKASRPQHIDQNSLRKTQLKFYCWIPSRPVISSRQSVHVSLHKSIRAFTASCHRIWSSNDPSLSSTWSRIYGSFVLARPLFWSQDVALFHCRDPGWLHFATPSWCVPCKSTPFWWTHQPTVMTSEPCMVLNTRHGTLDEPRVIILTPLAPAQWYQNSPHHICMTIHIALPPCYPHP